MAISLDAARAELLQNDREDRWVDISAADYLFLTSNRPKRIAYAYQEALAGAPDFYFDSACAQMKIFQGLGVLTEQDGDGTGSFSKAWHFPGTEGAAGTCDSVHRPHDRRSGNDAATFPDSLRRRPGGRF